VRAAGEGKVIAMAVPKRAAASLVLIWAVAICMVSRAAAAQDRPDDHCTAAGRPAKVLPDLGAAVLPPNIAPLSFLIQEKGHAYFVRITSKKGQALEIAGTSGLVRPDSRAWHRLLADNAGGDLQIDVYVRAATDKGAQAWTQFTSLHHAIAKEPIDDFLVYRRIRPGHSTWRDMGIYQRDLRSFDESPILDNGHFKHGCVNCHTFCNNRPEKMLLGIRSQPYGSSAILVDGAKVAKIGTKFGYAAWHPSGTFIAFSVNDVRQVFHSAANEVRDVMDFDSFIATFRPGRQQVRSVPGLANKDRLETYPTWSPDGKTLYFCTAPRTWQASSLLEGTYDKIRYDLGRISYDIAADHWGDPETILTSQDAGGSILLPRVSPDGRWLLVTLCDYGCFPVYRKASDLVLMDLTDPNGSGRHSYRRLEINSDASESWHCWSSNGRWIAFSSKRLSHIFTRIYLAHVDEQGKVSEPLLLPQQDPDFYDSCLWTFSVPELITSPVQTRNEAIARVVRGTEKVDVTMPVTMATPKADAVPRHDEMQHQ
jgi:hypothetical protein